MTLLAVGSMIKLAFPAQTEDRTAVSSISRASGSRVDVPSAKTSLMEVMVDNHTTLGTETLIAVGTGTRLLVTPRRDSTAQLTERPLVPVLDLDLTTKTSVEMAALVRNLPSQNVL